MLIERAHMAMRLCDTMAALCESLARLCRTVEVVPLATESPVPLGWGGSRMAC